MNIEAFRTYCLAKKGVTEEFPFGANTLVFKVVGKMFALTDVELFDGINLKVDPEEGVELRNRYAFIQQAYHMNKQHWVTLVMEGVVPDKLIRTLIDKSYDLVVRGLTKSQKLTLDSI